MAFLEVIKWLWELTFNFGLLQSSIQIDFDGGGGDGPMKRFCHFYSQIYKHVIR